MHDIILTDCRRLQILSGELSLQNIPIIIDIRHASEIIEKVELLYCHSAFVEW